VALAVLAYLLLLRLYGRDKSLEKEFSIFQLKQRFTADVFQDQLHRTEQRWKEKLDQLRAAA
jgi:hypothetical protein